MKNPIATIVDKAIDYVSTNDPSWEVAQPVDFKIRVVEQWKKAIRSELQMNSRVLWQLSLGDNTFGCMAPIFCSLDWNYNPYVLGLHKPHLFKKI